MRLYIAALLFLVGIPCGEPGWSAHTATTTTQSVAEPTLEKKLDDTLAEYASRDAPGVAVGVVQHGELVYSKGFGMANIEHGSPITRQSVFYIGSVSKQFTAACAALLIERGKLRLSDDVRKYLPELPEYEHTITVDHLLHHASGVRDWTSLLLFRGEDPRYEQRVSNDDVVRLLCRQKQPKFPPVSEYRYSNGGYVLLTTLLERVAGDSLREFCDAST